MTDADAAPPELVLDLSRLLSRIRHATPTGVDRCEMAYARGLLRRVPDRLRFAALHQARRYGRIPADAALRFLDATETAWEHGQPRGAARHARLIGQLARMRPRAIPAKRGRRVVVQSSPHHLEDARATAAILRREGAAFVCLLHDLIPIDYPEYARPGGAATHRRRVATVARLADGAIANSAATRASFLAHADRAIPVEVAHLGLDPHPPCEPARAERPYFVCLGTIEPRKNHLLLLNLWRGLSERHGASAIPKLMVIGRRGWENEQVVDMLERCPALIGCVEECAELSDARLRALLAGATGLLLPSFAEGYGMPVPEALAMGVPVICSDLPALREAGGDVPCYLDPLDGPGWTRAILRLAHDPAARAEQRARLAGWRRPSWDAHLDVVLALADRVAR